MATTTTPVGFTPDTVSGEAAPAKQGFLARFLESLIQARIQRAQREVQPYLAKMSDERLKDLGFTGSDIEKLREKHYVQAVYWS